MGTVKHEWSEGSSALRGHFGRFSRVSTQLSSLIAVVLLESFPAQLTKECPIRPRND